MSTRLPTSRDIPLPTNKAIRDVLDGLLGRAVTLEDGAPFDPLAPPGSCTGVYVDDNNAMTGLVLMNFHLTAHVGVALGLMPVGAAEAAIEDGEISASLEENVYEMLNVLASVLNGCSEVHQRLHQMYGPGRLVPLAVAPWQRVLGRRIDLLVSIRGYGRGRLSVITALDS